ncbi:porin [uncultured Gimesia sp.]|uniref:OprO/OprP family phosphate-selective porin n=1 Tax=uncultured Gimesia sp. TaxID=1678688 RepID=UPI0030DCFF91|tara:strand:- start:46820 stop:48328 length:1509 start_codon:yes stop_codon:yes gene_type:complete
MNQETGFQQIQYYSAAPNRCKHIISQPLRTLSIWSLTLFFALSLSVLESMAQPPAPEPNETGVHSHLQSLQRQIDELKSQQTLMNQSPNGPVPSEEDEYDSDLPSLLSNDPANGNQYPTARLTGFFQADSVWFHQDSGNIQAVGNLQDGADFRRARLAATGDAWENIGYMLEMDFAFPGRPSFMDVWLEVREAMGTNTVRIGQYRQPLGMDGLTSVKELTFLERALPFAFLPFRQIGAMTFGHSEDEQSTWALSGFRFPTDTYGGNVGDSGGYGLATRLTHLLIDNGDGNGLLHVGGGYSFGNLANNLLQYRNQPEIFVSETGGAAQVPVGVPTNVPPFVNTGLIPTQNFNLFNAELAYAIGSFYAQSEVLYSHVLQRNGQTNSFSGAYAHFGYFLTGESRAYNRKGGVFGRVVPLNPYNRDGGCGAWEVAGRWSYIDLNDKNIQGGRLTDLTFGVNWYLNQYTKFQFNYIHAFLNSSPAVNGPVVKNSNADILAVRAQVDF